MRISFPAVQGLCTSVEVPEIIITTQTEVGGLPHTYTLMLLVLRLFMELPIQYDLSLNKPPF